MQGEKFGTVDDIMIDKVSGKAIYALMSFGDFLHIGEKYHPPSWSTLKYDERKGDYIVNLDQRILENAPTDDMDEDFRWAPDYSPERTIRGASMKSFVRAVALGLSLAAGSAHAQTAIQPGLWEVSDKTTMEGVQPMPSTSRQVCVKGGEAILERLLYPTPDDFAKHGCTFTPGSKQDGIFKATTSCPATDQTPGVAAEAEISYTPTSYEGLGQLTVKGKDGTTLKGSSVLSGKRVGDC